MSDQDCRGTTSRTQVIGGGDQVVDIRGELRVGKFALAHAEPGEIEAQHADAAHRQPLGNTLGREIVLAAGEAMREQCEGYRFAEREIDQGRQFIAFGIGKFEPLGAHGVPFLINPSPQYLCV